ncbi:MAG: cell envelope integrity protein TolA [Proteobacteria bacterium]|nr:cell envelope integrity protein TolA [Burkholderiales bacterium]
MVPKAASRADIELKAKEAAKRAEDDKRAADAAKKRQDELASEKLNAKVKAQAQKEEQAKLAEAERLRREQDELARKAAEASASAQGKLLAAYADKIRAKVRRFIVEPPGGVPASAMAEFDVVLIPGGDVLSIKLRKSSGNTLYDEAVERAILRAQPLPIPPEPQQFAQFRTLILQIRPQE